MAERSDLVELRLLRAFAVLADELNFGRAAERLHVTQPALSAQLRQLEQRLGVTLFDRNTRRVGLSPEGLALLGPARVLLGEAGRFADAVAQARGKPQRRLVFGAALYTLEIPERQILLETFFARHPNVPLRVTPLWQREVIRALLRDEADLALLLGAPSSLAQWEADATAEVVFPESLPRLILRRERIGLLTPRESPLAQFEVIPQAALADVQVAMLGASHGGAILGPVRKALGDAHARLTVPPEPHGIGVERYGRQFRIPAVSLGWFNTGGPDDPDMVRRPVEGLELLTELALVRSSGQPSASAALFWDEARGKFPQATAVG